MGKVEQEIDKLLDQYLDGRLSTDEVRLLHRQLEAGNNPNNGYSTEFDEWVERVTLPDDLLHYTPTIYTEPAYKKQIAYDEDTLPLVSGRQILLWGVLFIFIMSLSLYWYVLPFEKNQSLFDKYFQPLPLHEVTYVTNSQKDNDLWRSAIFKYSDRKYAIAIQDLEKIRNNNNDSDSEDNDNVIELLIGVCLLADREVNRALPHLTNLAASESPLHQQAKWFAALAYLQNSDSAKARFYLEQIAQNPQAYNNNMANVLLLEMNNY